MKKIKKLELKKNVVSKLNADHMHNIKGGAKVETIGACASGRSTCVCASDTCNSFGCSILCY